MAVRLTASCQLHVSPPSRAAWIEMTEIGKKKVTSSSPPSRAAWIEITTPLIVFQSTASPPSRAAWIEMLY